MNGFLVPIGTPRLFGRLDPAGVVVVGEDGCRCVILTAVEHDDLHRALLTGARNLRLTTVAAGAVPFTTTGVLGEMSRHLPEGFRMGAPQPVTLRDVHGTGRVHFSALVGGRALDDEVEAPPPSETLGSRRLPSFARFA